MRSLLIVLIFLYNMPFMNSQAYGDYIGAGHNRGIVVTSSSEDERSYFYQKASGEKTISGEGLIAKQIEASRFLTQASFGVNQKEIDHVVEIGIEAWIDEQYKLASSNVLTQADSFARVLYNYYIAQGEDPEELSDVPGWQHFRYAWWNTAVYGKDQLRQRMTYALSQILVISDDSDFGGMGRGMSYYHDMLAKHAFGNYRDLLLEMALNPCMGSYLSHLNNPREIPEENIHPDQNFAREIMQLFTIGLFELNQDGSRKLDNDGNFIPTYNNEDIAELAKVFTGLGMGASLEGMDDPYFGQGIYGSDLTKPMKMYEEWHQAGEKKLIQNITIPDGQDGMKDIEDAIDMLFNHPNVGPFIVRQLIQRFVTSNPSPEYISRAAAKFNNDGSGIRGNLFEVVKAILLDEEARNCENILNPFSGKMIEPVLRNTNYIKAIGLTSSTKYFFHHGYQYQMYTNQHPYSAPSVFNFYAPDFKPSGVLAENNLNAPEFKLLNTLTSLDFGNFAYDWTYNEHVIDNWEGEDWHAHANASDFFVNAHNEETLINQIDIIFTNGQMSESTRAAIKESIAHIWPTLDGARARVNMALYLTLISPDYIIKK